MQKRLKNTALHHVCIQKTRIYRFTLVPPLLVVCRASACPVHSCCYSVKCCATITIVGCNHVTVRPGFCSAAVRCVARRHRTRAFRTSPVSLEKLRHGHNLQRLQAESRDHQFYSNAVPWCHQRMAQVSSVSCSAMIEPFSVDLLEMCWKLLLQCVEM